MHLKGSSMTTLRQMTLEDSRHIHDIDRSELINFVYRFKNGHVEELPAGHECPSWDVDERSEIVARFKHELSNGGTAFGAYEADLLVGFGVLGHDFLGRTQDQLELSLLYVSRQYRRQGIGSQIFNALCSTATERGARSLYISATETESAVKFYSNRGSELAMEVIEELYLKEPHDIHMEKEL